MKRIPISSRLCILSLEVLVLLCSETVSQAPSQVILKNKQTRGRQIAALASIEAKTGSKIAVTWDEITGTPSYLMGDLTAQGFVQQERNARRAAIRFLSENKSVFLLNSPRDELTLLNTRIDERGGVHVLFNRVHKGLTILGSQLAVHSDVSGRVESVNGRYHPSLTLSITPTISSDQAIDISKGVPATEQINAPTAELVIYPRESELRLAWKIVASTIEFPKMLYIIDANSGEVLLRDTGIRH